MSHKIIAEKHMYYIIPAINLAGELNTNQEIHTSHAVLEFDNEAEWLDRLDDLGYELEDEDIDP